MARFKVVLQETSFYILELDADDDAKARKEAQSYVARFPGIARKNARGLVLWHSEEIADLA